MLRKYNTSVYLDDMRTPRPNAYHDWIVLRSHEELVAWVLANGLPDFISFDHDLADEHFEQAYELNHETVDYSTFTEMTGFDAAKWMVNYCLDNGLPFPDFTVHSANPPGAANILGLLNNFRKHMGQAGDGVHRIW